MREKQLDHYMETSAKTGENADLLLQTLAKHLYLNKEKLQKMNDFFSDPFITKDYNASRKSFKLQKEETKTSKFALFG